MPTLLVLALACGSADPAPAAPSEPSTTESTGSSTGDTPPGTSADTGPREVPWRRGLPPLTEGVRTITHLHSPWSHDACDGDGLVEGVVNEPCLGDLREGLCDAGIDVAFFTDHPAHAAAQPFDDLFHPRAGDQRDGAVGVIPCGDGRSVRWYAGFEDELMPIGLTTHVPGDAVAREAAYNEDSPEAVQRLLDAGAHVFVAHTEGRDLAKLQEQQDAGLTGVEIFNLHAMFAPDIRAEHLGLDSILWLGEIADFTDPDGSAEPDLFVLAVLQRQAPSLERFDALLARGPMVGIVGTDAHQNVLDIALRDDERADSYRRMLRWMGNIVLPDPGEDPKAALGAGKSYVAFEILGTPTGFAFTAEDGTPMGGTTTSRTLSIDCPTLHPESPRGPDAPEIAVRLLRDGQEVATSCGDHAVEPGVYRVEVDMVPHHLRPFLGDVADVWIQSYPWLLTNAIRVE